MSDYQNKSPEKSSPSFPEDDDENVMDFDRSISPSSQAENNQNIFKNDSFNISNQEIEQKQNNNQSKVIGSPNDLEKSTMDDTCTDFDFDAKQTSMTEGDKKVHWTNENIVALLDCVESHLNDFSVSRKHKFVWQTIGRDMEHLGFNTEHCYNKWKNLRRDVRLLVNNPLKVVRNADILKRVARLILIIYPNVDAYTMQVNNDRNGSRSNPSTPNFKRCDSPSMAKLATYTNLPQQKNSSHGKQNPPSTVLFTNIAPAPFNTNNNGYHEAKNKNVDLNNNNGNKNTNPLLFNPASFLVQSQMFNDILKQNIKLDEDTLKQLLGNSNDPNNNMPMGNSTPTPPTQNNQFNSNIQANNLASTILNTIYPTNNNTSNNANNNQNLLSSFVENLLNNQSQNGPITSGQSYNPFEPKMNTTATAISDELTGVVEKLKDEETVHLRLTEMITHLAEELRASGFRRQAILDKIMSHIKTGSSPNAGSIGSDQNNNTTSQLNNNNSNGNTNAFIGKHNANQAVAETVNSFG